ncbi:hypothetical protein ACFPAF_07795 [Hymenobacter endophyticus]|uniref:Uncharacterized protein n=1 Tax=Hymenobacter endophyticus TaxID=3076335 RepID=A0ABU3TG05_9BACT|nr:hypothetical protein [Hymenobacter endophyticus]MDU0370288.1 hypothetical protein [Hymenobacter endophyticus]
MQQLKYRRGTCYRPNQKVRGGKRHLRRLQAESTCAALLSIDALLARQYYYAKLGLHPWHGHRQPPKLVRQLAAQHLLTTFFAWQPALAALSEPVYSAVWLVGPEFAHSSQVVAGIGERTAYYRTIFGEADPDGPPLPAEYRELPNANKLTWQTHPWHILVDSVDYPEGWPAWALEKPNYPCQPEDNDEYLLVQTGWVWVGTLPAALPA